MRTIRAGSAILGVACGALAAVAHAEPVRLTDAQLDRVTAGASTQDSCSSTGGTCMSSSTEGSVDGGRTVTVTKTVTRETSRVYTFVINGRTVTFTRP